MRKIYRIVGRRRRNAPVELSKYYWYRKAEYFLEHQEYGPAFIDKRKGFTVWCYRGEIHRLSGPAVIADERLIPNNNDEGDIVFNISIGHFESLAVASGLDLRGREWEVCGLWYSNGVPTHVQFIDLERIRTLGN